MNATHQEKAIGYLLTHSHSQSSRAAESVAHILKTARMHLGMDIAFIAELVDRQPVFRHIEAAGNELPFQVGEVALTDGNYCQRMMEGSIPQLIPDTSTVPGAAELPVTRALPVGAYVGVPIRLQDGSVYGTFCCLSFAPDHSLNERDLKMMRVFADLTAYHIDQDLDKAREHSQKIAQVRRIIEKEQLSTVYQPIYNLTDNRIVGFECLTRFSEKPARTPDVWFAEAMEVGLGVQLEGAAIRKALLGLSLLPGEVYLALNVSPTMLLSSEFASMLDEVPADRVVLELTEHTSISDYSALSIALEPLRRRRIRLAVDDAGAGYASLQHILNLQPDIIKIDLSLIKNIDIDPARRALTSALINFSREIGSSIVAEGVETVAELDTLRVLGVRKAQGYVLQRPMLLADAARLCGFKLHNL